MIICTSNEKKSKPLIAACSAWLPVAAAGKQTGAAIDDYLKKHPGTIELIFSLFQAYDDSASIQLEAELSRFRKELAFWINADQHEVSKMRSERDTCLTPEMFRAWRKTANDPDDQIEVWVEQRVPMGVTCHPVHKGIFPVIADEEDIQDPLTLLEFEAKYLESRWNQIMKSRIT